MLRRAFGVALFLLASSAIAVALAAIAVRSPVVWPLVPPVAFRWADALVAPESQEDVAEVEFLAYWGCAFAGIAVVGGMAVLVRRRFRKLAVRPSFPSTGREST